MYVVEFLCTAETKASQTSGSSKKISTSILRDKVSSKNLLTGLQKLPEKIAFCVCNLQAQCILAKVKNDLTVKSHLFDFMKSVNLDRYELNKEFKAMKKTVCCMDYIKRDSV